MKIFTIGYVLITAFWMGGVILKTFVTPDKGSWPDWLAAVGTIGAFGGTIWIASSEQIRKSRHDKDKAVVTLLSIAVNLTHARGNIGRMLRNLETDQALQPHEYATFIQSFKQYDSIPREAVVDIVPFDQGIADDVIRGQAQYNMVIGLCNLLSNNTEELPNRTTAHNQLLQCARAAHSRFGRVVEVCDRIA